MVSGRMALISRLLSGKSILPELCKVASEIGIRDAALQCVIVRRGAGNRTDRKYHALGRALLQASQAFFDGFFEEACQAQPQLTGFGLGPSVGVVVNTERRLLDRNLSYLPDFVKPVKIYRHIAFFTDKQLP